MKPNQVLFHVLARLDLTKNTIGVLFCPRKRKASKETKETRQSLKVTVYLQIGNFLQIWIFGSN